MKPKGRIRPGRDDPQLIPDSPISPPFSPSWLDRLQAWIERLPVPWWSTYLFAAVLLVLLMHIPRWLDASLPRGSFEVNQSTLAIGTVYFFAFIHYLNTSSRRALANYRPLLHVKAAEYASYDYTLSRMPSRLGYFTVLLGAALGGLSFIPDPESWGVQPTFSALSMTSSLLGALCAMIGATYWMVQVIRQARTIDRIHRITKRVNLFHRDPVYSFSILTLRSAIGLLLFVYSYLFIALYLGLAAIPNAVDAAVMGVAIAVALAIFFLPLSRMHGLLGAEKKRLLLETDERYSRLVDRFNSHVDKGKFADIDTTARTIAALVAQRDILAKVSPWPWRPETLRSLLSTVALPVMLYLASRLAGRLFGV